MEVSLNIKYADTTMTVYKYSTVDQLSILYNNMQLIDSYKPSINSSPNRATWSDIDNIWIF